MRKISFALIFMLALSAQVHGEITPQETRVLVEDICELLVDNYVFPDIAGQICDTLRSRLEAGYYAAGSYDELSDLLSRDLKSVNNDLHLNAWSITPSPRDDDNEKPDLVDLHLNIIRKNAERGFDFKKMEILPGNIGYLELTKFKSIPDVRLERMLEGAMDFLSCTSAMILDLRRNNGGNFRMIEKFMSYFFEERTELTGRYSRRSAGIRESYTKESVGGGYLTDIPLFVLVSTRTVSGPESVAYDLQTLRRAVIIGERTKGAANPSNFYRIREKLLVCIPYGYAVNPVTSSNWEGTGVTPDISVPADSAMAVAMRLAEKAAAEVQAREQQKVDSLVVELKRRMGEIDSLLKTDPQRAGELFESTLESFFSIDYMDQYLLLAWMNEYGEAGDTRGVEMVALQGINRYPEDDRFYARLGDLYYDEGKMEKALSTYRSLLELDPNDRTVSERVEEISGRSSSWKDSG